MSDFWNALINSPFVRTASEQGTQGSLDHFLSDNRVLEGSHHSSVRQLTDHIKNSKCLKLPVESGARVTFASNLGSVLTYDNPPMPNTFGTVYGDSTTHEGMVFVKWDSGEFGAFNPQHLYPSKTKQAKSVSFRVSTLGDLSSLFSNTKKEGELIHKATQDLWSFKKTENGFFIERLFDDSGEPLKV